MPTGVKLATITQNPAFSLISLSFLFSSTLTVPQTHHAFPATQAFAYANCSVPNALSPGDSCFSLFNVMVKDLIFIFSVPCSWPPSKPRNSSLLGFGPFEFVWGYFGDLSQGKDV